MQKLSGREADGRVRCNDSLVGNRSSSRLHGVSADCGSSNGEIAS